MEDDMEKFRASKKRLDAALNATILAWPKVSPCWIDIISEPTVELEEKKLKHPVSPVKERRP